MRGRRGVDKTGQDDIQKETERKTQRETNNAGKRQLEIMSVG